MVADLYDHIKSLEDIQFFIKYCTQLLPPRPEDVSGHVVWNNILDLQKQLTIKRDVSTEYYYIHILIIDHIIGCISMRDVRKC